MALEKTTISINLGNGLDQKTDSKVGPDNKFNYMQNWIYDKLGKLYKRFGTDKLTDQIVTTFPNPLSIGTSEIPSSTFSYGDQLLSQNKGALYSYFEDQDKWYFKGHYYPFELTTQNSVAGDPQYSNPTSFYVAGLRIIVYYAVDPAASFSQLRYTVIENSTGNYLVDDVAIGNSSSYFYPQIISFASRYYLAVQNINNIALAEINSATGVVGSFVNVATDAKLPFVTIDTPFLPEYPFQFVITNKAGIGERAIFVYYNTSNQVKMIAVKDDGTVDSAIVAYTNPQTVNRGFGIQYNVASDSLFIAYQLSSLAVVYQSLTFNSSGFTAVFNSTVATTTGNIISFDLSNSPVNTSQVLFLFDEYRTTAYLVSGSLKSFTEPIIYKAVLTSGSIATASSAYITGFQIAAKSITDTFRSTIYTFIQNTAGDNQKTFFMIDLLKGKTENAPYVQAKWKYGTAQPRTSASPPQTSFIGNKIYSSLGSILDLIGNPNGTTATAPTLAAKIGISENFVDLTPVKSGTNAFLSNAVHTSGGYLGYYDGSTFTESSYFLMPELLDYSKVNAVTGVWATFFVFRQGDSGNSEITDFTMPIGSQVQVGPTSFLVFYTTVSQVNVGFRKDGVGTIPTGPGTNILIDILSTDSSFQVATKTISGINAAGVAATASLPSGMPLNTVRITNNSNGVVTDASVSGTSYIPPVGMDAGTYQYKVIWTYYDVHGQIVLSGTSPAVTVSGVVTNDIVNLMVYAPVLTNRDVATVRIQWFRTKSNGTEFFKISSVVQDNPWQLGKWIYNYSDNKKDVAISNSPENLYTTGGVLDNFQIPQIKHVSRFKNRLIASGSDDQTSFFYSKTAIPGAPVEFAAEFEIQLDNDSDPITGHAQLDDKLIVFKERKIYYLAGDGANDLGQNQTFTLPLLIATDVGCLSHNTIVTCPLGLLFKSDKGIYLLNRALQLSYIGKEVEEYNQNIVSNGLLIDDQNQIRFNLQDENISLVYDYIFNRWAIFTNYGGTEATIWKSNYTRIDYSGRCYVENKSSWIDSGSLIESYQPTFETHWLQLKNVQDYQRIYRLAFLGDLRSPHNLNYKIYYDYDDTQYDAYTFSSSNITGNQLGDSVYQPIVHLRQQKCDAIKIVIEVEPLGGTEECLQLVDMAFIVGVKRGLMKVRARKML